MLVACYTTESLPRTGPREPFLPPVASPPSAIPGRDAIAGGFGTVQLWPPIEAAGSVVLLIKAAGGTLQTCRNTL
jgi:hypothetical protein